MPSIEQNSSLEKLTAYKQDVWAFRNALIEGLGKFFPNVSYEKKEMFYIQLKAVVYGVYPLTHLTDKQIQAMKNVNPDYIYSPSRILSRIMKKMLVFYKKLNLLICNFCISLQKIGSYPGGNKKV